MGAANSRNVKIKLDAKAIKRKTHASDLILIAVRGKSKEIPIPNIKVKAIKIKLPILKTILLLPI